MATVTLYLQKTGAGDKFRLQPQKLFAVDSIGDYLNSWTVKTVVNDVQYQKNSLELDLKLDLSQSYSQPFGTEIVYVAINQDFKSYYYYPKRVEWRGKSAVRLELVMDVLNTFKPNTDYKFTDRTHISREHRDRIELGYPIYATITTNEDVSSMVVGTEYCLGGAVVIPQFTLIAKGILLDSSTSEGVTTLHFNLGYWNRIQGVYLGHYWREINGVYVEGSVGTLNGRITDYESTLRRIIDKVSENVNPLLYKNDSMSLIDKKTALRDSWYLLYKNQNDPTDSLVNPVECYLIPEFDLPAKKSSSISSGRLSASSLVEGYYYYIPISVYTSYFNNAYKITLDSTTYTAYSSDSFDLHTKYIILWRVGDKITAVYVDWYSYDATRTFKGFSDLDFVIIENAPVYYKGYALFDTSMEQSHDKTTNWWYTAVWTTNSFSYVLNGVEDLDRTQAKNIKLIKLPYCPIDFEVGIDENDEPYIDIDNSGFSVETLYGISALKLSDINTKFKRFITFPMFDIGSPKNNLIINEDPADFTVSDLRNDNLESKIYHSEFFRPTFFYDSFSYSINLEDVLVSNYTTLSDEITVRFFVTSTINSRFAFSFTSLITYTQETDNFPYILSVVRNNEEVLYNVPYINYIRTGFNYDVKSKNLQQTSAWLGATGSLASTVVALAFPSATLKVAGVVAGLISTAMAVKNAVTTQIQTENSLQEKILTAKNQSTSVSGSDDVDILDFYNGNSLRYAVYKPRDFVKDLLLDLFHYTGYKTNKMAIPNLETRTWFNYIEADIEITPLKNMSQEIITELVGLYKTGVTVLHKNIINTVETWDWDQTHENYEVSIIGD